MFMPEETRTLEERVADLEKKAEELEKELNRKASKESLNKGLSDLEVQFLNQKRPRTRRAS